MPRKPKAPAKQTIVELVNGKPITIILHPPTGSRTSWFVYWSGLVSSRSTGQTQLENAIVAARHMVQNQGERAKVADALLTDEEFKEIQRAHFGRKTDPDARRRAEESLRSCMSAITAFEVILKRPEIGYHGPLSGVTSDQCAEFQSVALRLPKNLLRRYPKGKVEVEPYDSNTVERWSRELQAAYERVHREGKRCVRGIVAPSKLLEKNPWIFTWRVEGGRRRKRQFTDKDLLGLLDWFDTTWTGVTVATAMSKVFLWSGCRREEVDSLSWDAFHEPAEGEYHFEIVGKRGVQRYFRIPAGLYQMLTSLRTGSPYVFAAYNDQLREFHRQRGRLHDANRVSKEYEPATFGDWFYKRMREWGETVGFADCTPHAFRRSTMQYALRGDAVADVAADIRVGPGVMRGHYVNPERRAESNRVYARLLQALPPEVARRYGHELQPKSLAEQIAKAARAGDMALVQRLAAQSSGDSAATAG